MLNIHTVDATEFTDACHRVAAYSRTHECTAHLNATVRITEWASGAPLVTVTFRTSDWYDSDTTVATWTNGKRHD